MKNTLAFGLGIMLLVSSLAYSADDAAQTPIIKGLWPAGTTNSSIEVSERELPARGNIRRITDIKNPTLTLYPANTNSAGSVPAVLVFPGGGYSILAIDIEGTEIAEWLNSIGITAIVVKYRVPNNRNGAFQDGQRAIRLVRHHAKEWNIDSKSVGVIGFSAGGHLSARLSTDFHKRSYINLDVADKQDCRPDFCILMYPAYLANKKSKKVAKELPITSNTPPTFIIQTKDDRSFVDGTIIYAQALKNADVSSTFHLFEVGGHGYGLRPPKKGNETSQWPKLCKEWLKERSIINKVSNNEIQPTK